MEGTVEKSTLRYIIRDHDTEKFQQKKERMMEAAAYLNAKYGAGTVNITIRDSYFNMRQVIEPNIHVVERAKKAIEDLGIQPIVLPIRGGTDGARLSYVGLPCPNLGTGGENFHGRYEYACAEDMDLSVRALINILTAGK